MTAVEFLHSEYIKIFGELNPSTGKLVEIAYALEQAKEMEKKIIAQAFEDGDYNYFYNHQNGREFETGIEYYNETFKSE